MTRYDSKTKVLKLIAQYDLGNDVRPTEEVELSLAKLSELEAQRIISIAKLVMSFCNGSKIGLVTQLKTKDEKGVEFTKTIPSMLSIAQEKINKAVDNPKRVEQGSPETVAEMLDQTVPNGAAE